MNNIIILFKRCAFLFVLLILNSCTSDVDDYVNEKTIATRSHVEQKIESIEAYNGSLIKNDYLKLDALLSKGISEKDFEDNARIVLKDQIDYGQLVYEAYMTHWENTGELNKLNNIDRAFLENLDVEYYLLFTILNSTLVRSGIEPSDNLVGCLADAIGITTVLSWIRQGFTGMLTADTALAFLRAYGTRALGIIGAAIIIYNFVDCLQKEEGLADSVNLPRFANCVGTVNWLLDSGFANFCLLDLDRKNSLSFYSTLSKDLCLVGLSGKVDASLSVEVKYDDWIQRGAPPCLIDTIKVYRRKDVKTFVVNGPKPDLKIVFFGAPLSKYTLEIKMLPPSDSDDALPKFKIVLK